MRKDENASVRSFFSMEYAAIRKFNAQFISEAGRICQPPEVLGVEPGVELGPGKLTARNFRNT